MPFTASDPDILIAAVRASGVKRYLVVDGAGNLEAAPGKRVFDMPDFPEIYRAEARGASCFSTNCAKSMTSNGGNLSPGAEFVAGERAGKFRLGLDARLAGREGSPISFEDYAIGLIDEP